MHLPSATILLRPTVAHADVVAIITDDVKKADPPQAHPR